MRTATTFLENALKKAKALFDLVGKPSLADDSGLIVRALGGEPGVLSARYGSVDGSAKLGGRRAECLPPRQHGL